MFFFFKLFHYLFAKLRVTTFLAFWLLKDLSKPPFRSLTVFDSSKIISGLFRLVISVISRDFLVRNLFETGTVHGILRGALIMYNTSSVYQCVTPTTVARKLTLALKQSAHVILL